MFRTSNPALTEKTFRQFEYAGDTTMTVQGVVNKTGFLLVCVLLTASWTWNIFYEKGAEAMYPWMIGGFFGGLLFAVITIFVPTRAAITAPLYCLFEGLFLGGLSSYLNSRFGGIVIQAVGLTFGTLFCMLVAYTTRLVRATEKFKMGIFAATGGICVIYLVSMIFGLFNVEIPYIHGSGLIGIGFSLFVVVIAALNLVLDFDFIENGSRQGAPKYMEWIGAFGLMVTLVWLYIEILRLLSKLRSRN